MPIQSPSEEHGVALLTPEDADVLSIGISTGGEAEIRMAQLQPGRHIIATTLDKEGAAKTRQKITAAGLSSNIKIKVEDVSLMSGYTENQFHFIYARLVLHYLTAQQLRLALKNLYRVLRRAGRIFVVVRSTECPEAKQPGNTFNSRSCMTAYKSYATGILEERYFHTRKTITVALEQAGFMLVSLDQYDEALSPSFDRNDGKWIDNNVIEAVAIKV